ncbi:TMEM175 family protein [Microbacterium sp.]|uniref:TMEM175 family protein n=1 Tax=Microbacterium sp. TaxID=51671 RepID=UPI003A922B54
MDATDRADSDINPSGRIEAFSDGVIAVAITLLVLDLAVPEPAAGLTLGEQLLAMWPNYLAYVVSFVAIGIMWINHHAMLRRLRGVDHTVLVLNLFLLLCIAVLPFTTSLLATYLLVPDGGHLAAVVYAGSFLVTSIVFFGMQVHLMRRPQLLRHPLAARERRAILTRASLAPPAYVLAGLLGVVEPYLTLAVCVVLGVLYLLPSWVRRRRHEPRREDAGAHDLG